MAIRVDGTKITLANRYTDIGKFLGLAPDDPGPDPAPLSEASGAGYTRVATTWFPGVAGVMSGKATTIQVDTGTYRYVLLCSDHGPTMFDNCQIFPVITLSAAGSIVLTPTYTQS